MCSDTGVDTDLLAKRRTTIAMELRDDLQAFVAQVIKVGRQMVSLTEELSSTAEAVFTDAGAQKLDFRALRTCLVTLAVEADANIREAQTLARHATPELTANVYAKTRDARLAELAESIGERVLSAQSRATSVHRKPSEATVLDGKLLPASNLDENRNNGGGGKRTPPAGAIQNADFGNPERRIRRTRCTEAPSGPRFGTHSGPLADTARAYQGGGLGAGPEHVRQGAIPMSSIERRIQRAEKCIGINEASEADTLTTEELEQIRTTLRMAFESGAPLTLPADHIAGERGQAL